MCRIIITVLFAFAFVGCTTTGKYGNFVPPTAVANQQQLASDAVRQLTVLYPPAKTHLQLKQATPDAFGQALVLTLRERGYAIMERDSPGAKTQATSVSSSAVPASLPLRYVLDQLGEPDLYRLTLLIGNQSIARPYLLQGTSFVPAGYWVRKE